MRIIKAKFSNFRRLIAEEISFDRPLTVLVGKNNSGKSTLLEGLAIMLQAHTGRMSLSKRVGNIGDISIELYLRFNEDEWGRILNSMSSTTISYAGKDIDLKTLIPSISQLNLIYRWIVQVHDGVESNAKRSITFDGVLTDIMGDFQAVDSLIFNFILGHLNLNSFVGLVYLPTEPAVTEFEQFLPFNGLTTRQDRNNFIRNNLYHLKKTEHDKYDYLVERLSHILENIVATDVLLNEETGNIDLTLMQGEYQSNLFEMGSGTKTILTILCRLVSSKSTIALLDEPDRHLHPSLVRQLAQILKELSNFKQLIISSHNSTFVDVFDRQSILHVRAISPITSSVSPLIEAKEAIGILDDLGVTTGTFSLVEVQSSSVVLLGEGVSDWNYLQRFATKLGKFEAIKSLRPKYVSLDGNKKVPSELLDRMYGSPVPFILIRDRDEINESDRNRIEEKLGRDRCHFLNRREIENYALDYHALMNTLTSKGFTKENSIKKKIDGLNEEILKDKIKSLAEELKTKVILLRFVNDLPVLKLFHREEIHDFVNKNVRNDLEEALNYVDAELIDKLKKFRKEKLREILQQHQFAVEAEWTESGILKLCPGKDLLKLINKWTMNEFGISISVLDLIENLDKIDQDIVDLCEKIIKVPVKKD
jgi:predicted ATPase